METQLPKIKYADNEQFEAYLEIDGDIAYLHLKVHKWSPSCLKKLYSYLAVLKIELLENGINGLATVSPNPKFCRMMGAKSLFQLEHEGINYEVLVWDLK